MTAFFFVLMKRIFNENFVFSFFLYIFALLNKVNYMSKEEVIQYLETLESKDDGTNIIETTDFLDKEGWKVHVDIAINRDAINKNNDAVYFYYIPIDELVNNEKVSKEDMNKWFQQGWKLNNEKNCIIKII